MSCYSDYIRYLVISLAVLYALADGHLLCAPCLASSQHICEHSQHHTPGIFTSASCCSDDHNRRLLCNGNDLPAIVVQCSVDELAKLLEFHAGIFVFAEYQPSLPGLCDSLTLYSSARSLRLHLLYGVLLN